MRFSIHRPMSGHCCRGIRAQEVVPLPILRWPNWPRREAAPAIRADVFEDRVDACFAKRTLEAANQCLERVGFQFFIAVFAAWPELEHWRLLTGGKIESKTATRLYRSLRVGAKRCPHVRGRRDGNKIHRGATLNRHMPVGQRRHGMVENVPCLRSICACLSSNNGEASS